MEEKIKKVIESITNVLMVKNARYGNSALEPIGVFYKGDSTSSIRIRLDDKLGRVRNSDELRKNDMFDILGYLILFCISEKMNCYTGMAFSEQVDDVMANLKNVYMSEKLNRKKTFVKVGDGHVLSKLMLAYEMEYIINHDITGYGDERESDAVYNLMADIVLYFALEDNVDFSDLID